LQLSFTALCSSGIGLDLLAEPFGKRASRTQCVWADKTSHLQGEPHTEIGPAEIADNACVVTMNLSRSRLAHWTASERVRAGHEKSKLLVGDFKVGQL
jgi:hypothetical protein